MSLIDKMKSKRLELRRLKLDSFKFKIDDLTYVIDRSEKSVLAQKSKERIPTDSQLIQEVKKYVHSCEETIEQIKVFSNEGCNDKLLNEISSLERSINFISQYLPKQMTKDEIYSYAKTFLSYTPGAKMGVIMKSLKAENAGLYDGRAASNIIREMLKKDPEIKEND